jgi:hypothetical protein
MGEFDCLWLHPRPCSAWHPALPKSNGWVRLPSIASQAMQCLAFCATQVKWVTLNSITLWTTILKQVLTGHRKSTGNPTTSRHTTWHQLLWPPRAHHLTLDHQGRITLFDTWPLRSHLATWLLTTEVKSHLLDINFDHQGHSTWHWTTKVMSHYLIFDDRGHVTYTTWH